MRMDFMNAPRILLLLALGTLLAGCGFALRGSGELPPSLARTYIETDREGASLAREIERQLKVSGAQRVLAAEDSSAILKISENDAGQRILSVTTTGGPEEYEVYHVVRFEVDVGGRRVFGPQELTLTRDYTFDKTDVLGKRHEYDTLRESLRKDMASLILRRLSLAPDVP